MICTNPLTCLPAKTFLTHSRKGQDCPWSSSLRKGSRRLRGLIFCSTRTSSGLEARPSVSLKIRGLLQEELILHELRWELDRTKRTFANKHMEPEWNSESTGILLRSLLHGIFGCLYGYLGGAGLWVAFKSHVPRRCLSWFGVCSPTTRVEENLQVQLFQRPHLDCQKGIIGPKNHIWYGLWALIPYWQSKWTLWVTHFP